MNKRKKLLRMLLCLMIVAVPAFALAGCGAGDPEGQSDSAVQTESADATYEIQITGYDDGEDAAELFKRLNQYRSEQGMDTLGWNDAPAEALRVRAAELAVNFSENRLDGMPGEEMFRGACDAIDEGTDQLLQDEEFLAMLQDPENKSFSAGVYQSYSGRIYVAAGFFAKAGVKRIPSAKSEDRTFILTARDDALNCHGQLMNEEMDPEDPTELYKGEGYYYCIINNNSADENNAEDLQCMCAESSVPKVITIDDYGVVTAKDVGTATLTVRPAKESSIVFTQEVEVQ